MNKILLYSALILMVSCSSLESEEYYIEEDMLPHFVQFVEEGQKRGIQLELNEMSVEGRLESLAEQNILGQCIRDNLNPNQVVIDVHFWNRSSYLHREFIVFHELGHCVLERSHLDSVDEDGNCISIMNTGSVECRSGYTHDTREAFLDELFKN